MWVEHRYRKSRCDTFEGGSCDCGAENTNRETLERYEAALKLIVEDPKRIINRDAVFPESYRYAGVDAQAVAIKALKIR